MFPLTLKYKIGNLFQQAYTLADRIIVGRFVGDTAFSAIGATNALSMTFMSMCMGAAIGTGVVVSQYFGAKDEKGTAASIANGGYACLLIAIIMTHWNVGNLAHNRSYMDSYSGFRINPL